MEGHRQRLVSRLRRAVPERSRRLGRAGFRNAPCKDRIPAAAQGPSQAANRPPAAWNRGQRDLRPIRRPQAAHVAPFATADPGRDARHVPGASDRDHDSGRFSHKAGPHRGGAVEGNVAIRRRPDAVAGPACKQIVGRRLRGQPADRAALIPDGAAGPAIEPSVRRHHAPGALDHRRAENRAAVGARGRSSADEEHGEGEEHSEYVRPVHCARVSISRSLVATKSAEQDRLQSPVRGARARSEPSRP